MEEGASNAEALAFMVEGFSIEEALALRESLFLGTGGFSNGGPLFFSFGLGGGGGLEADLLMVLFFSGGE